MTTRHQQIKGFAVGTDFDVIRSVTGVPAGRTLARAWLTVKNAPADIDPGILQKVITPSAQAGVGQITDTGADGTGSVTFQFTGAQTSALITPGKRYVYDIQLELDDGTDSQFEEGVFRLHRRVTASN